MANDEKALPPDVHAMPDGARRVHRDYGLWIISGSSYRAPADGFHRTRERYFEYYSLSHMHEGMGRLWLPPNREFRVEPGWGVLICPGTLNRYGGVDGQPYFEDSIRFSGPVADMLRAVGVVADGLAHLGAARRVAEIAAMAADPSDDAQINANIALQRLLVELYNDRRRRDGAAEPATALLDSLVEEFKNRPSHWWTLDEMAEYCGLGTDQFRRVFIRRLGMNPKNYLDQLRMNKAVEMLLGTREPVARIAAGLGYLDQYHFARRFKQIIGFPPGRYRHEFSARLNSLI